MFFLWFLCKMVMFLVLLPTWLVLTTCSEISCLFFQNKIYGYHTWYLMGMAQKCSNIRGTTNACGVRLLSRICLRNLEKNNAHSPQSPHNHWPKTRYHQEETPNKKQQTYKQIPLDALFKKARKCLKHLQQCVALSTHHHVQKHGPNPGKRSLFLMKKINNQKNKKQS